MIRAFIHIRSWSNFDSHFTQTIQSHLDSSWILLYLTSTAFSFLHIFFHHVPFQVRQNIILFLSNDNGYLEFRIKLKHSNKYIPSREVGKYQVFLKWEQGLIPPLCMYNIFLIKFGRGRAEGLSLFIFLFVTA